MGDAEAIGGQAYEFAIGVENTVAAGQGAVTTGQARNEAGHVTVTNVLLNHTQKLERFDIVNTTNSTLRPGNMPPFRTGGKTTSTSVALCRYHPNFEAIVMSIDMGLPLDGTKQRYVRLQMFVRGPYTGLHRYVASDADVRLHSSASTDAGKAYDYDMQHGMLDPFTLYWRPALVDPAYPGGYYSFNRETALIYAKLVAWNASIHANNPPAHRQGVRDDWGVNPMFVIIQRLHWQHIAAAAGAVYVPPMGAPAVELANPWQLAIAARGRDKGKVRQYPAL